MIEYELEQLKSDEGFRAKPYKDSLGFDTIGYGTKLPLSRYESELISSQEVSKEEAEFLLRHRLIQYVSELSQYKPIFHQLDTNRQGVLCNMVYQLGVPNLLKFKKMWSAIEQKNYIEASEQMQDSRWFRQTPNRAKRLIKRMRGGRYE